MQQNFPGSFLRVSHKSYLSLVSSAASWTWWNGLLKCSQRSQHFKGFLEPAPLPCITPREGQKSGPKRNRKRTQETASKRENTLKPKCKRVIKAEMSRETLTEKKKLEMKEPKKNNFYSELILRSDEIRAQQVQSLLGAEFRRFFFQLTECGTKRTTRGRRRQEQHERAH